MVDRKGNERITLICILQRYVMRMEIDGGLWHVDNFGVAPWSSATTVSLCYTIIAT
jgi:hypothetical protein